MRPAHVVVLLLAGALGGAVIMKVVHSRKLEIPVANVEPGAPPATAPTEASAPEVPPPAVAEPQPAKPSPMPPPEPPPVAKPARARTVAAIAVRRPIPIAQPVPLLPTAPIAPTPLPAAAPPPDRAEPVPAPPPPPPVPQTRQVTLNAGMILPVRLVGGLSSERNGPGDVFAATLDQSLVADGFVVAQRGARVEGRVVAVERAHVRSAAAIALELTALRTSDGQTVPIRTDGYFQHADGGNADAIAGDVLPTRQPLDMPPETTMTFRLRNPVQLTEVR